MINNKRQRLKSDKEQQQIGDGRKEKRKAKPSPLIVERLYMARLDGVQMHGC